MATFAGGRSGIPPSSRSVGDTAVQIYLDIHQIALILQYRPNDNLLKDFVTSLERLARQIGDPIDPRDKRMIVECSLEHLPAEMEQVTTSSQMDYRVTKARLLSLASSYAAKHILKDVSAFNSDELWDWNTKLTTMQGTADYCMRLMRLSYHQDTTPPPRSEAAYGKFYDEPRMSLYLNHDNTRRLKAVLQAAIHRLTAHNNQNDNGETTGAVNLQSGEIASGTQQQVNTGILDSFVKAPIAAVMHSVRAPDSTEREDISATNVLDICSSSHTAALSTINDHNKGIDTAGDSSSPSSSLTRTSTDYIATPPVAHTQKIGAATITKDSIATSSILPQNSAGHNTASSTSRARKSGTDTAAKASSPKPSTLPHIATDRTPTSASIPKQGSDQVAGCSNPSPPSRSSRKTDSKLLSKGDQAPELTVQEQRSAICQPSTGFSKTGTADNTITSIGGTTSLCANQSDASATTSSKKLVLLVPQGTSNQSSKRSSRISSLRNSKEHYFEFVEVELRKWSARIDNYLTSLDNISIDPEQSSQHFAKSLDGVRQIHWSKLLDFYIRKGESAAVNASKVERPCYMLAILIEKLQQCGYSTNKVLSNKVVTSAECKGAHSQGDVFARINALDGETLMILDLLAVFLDTPDRHTILNSLKYDGTSRRLKIPPPEIDESDSDSTDYIPAVAKKRKPIEPPSPKRLPPRPLITSHLPNCQFGIYMNHEKEEYFSMREGTLFDNSKFFRLYTERLIKGRIVVEDVPDEPTHRFGRWNDILGYCQSAKDLKRWIKKEFRVDVDALRNMKGRMAAINLWLGWIMNPEQDIVIDKNLVSKQEALLLADFLGTKEEYREKLAFADFKST